MTTDREMQDAMVLALGKYAWGVTGRKVEGDDFAAGFTAGAAHARAQAGEPVAWLGPYKDAATALNELRKSVAEIIGADPETWPDHGNSPLAIAATLALARRTNPAPAQEPVAVPAGWDALDASIASLKAQHAALASAIAEFEHAVMTIIVNVRRKPACTPDELEKWWYDEKLPRIRAMLAAAPVSPPTDHSEDALDMVQREKRARALSELAAADGELLAAGVDRLPTPQPADHRRVQDADPAWPELYALFAEAKAQATQPAECQWCHGSGVLHGWHYDKKCPQCGALPLPTPAGEGR